MPEDASRLRDLSAAKQRRDAARELLAKRKKEGEYYGPKHPMPEELKADIEYFANGLVAFEAEVSKAEAQSGLINRKNDDLLKRDDKLLKSEFAPLRCDRN